MPVPECDGMYHCERREAFSQRSLGGAFATFIGLVLDDTCLNSMVKDRKSDDSVKSVWRDRRCINGHDAQENKCIINHVMSVSPTSFYVFLGQVG